MPSLPSSSIDLASMLRQAHPVVQTVMGLLLLAVFISWTILLAKSWELYRQRRRLRAAASFLQPLTCLPAIESAPTGLLQTLLQAVWSERSHSSGLSATGIKERAASRLAGLERHWLRQRQQGIGALATIASVAPFVGLFGTVWGIMNSFTGIARAHTTNLAVVAPGIAEALLATAFGLAAAIPAVVIYNHFSRLLGGLRVELADLSARLQELLSRDLDRPAPFPLQAVPPRPSPLQEVHA